MSRSRSFLFITETCTGKRQASSAQRPGIQKQYETVVAERRPLICTHCMVVGGTRHVEYERLVVPLAGEDDAEVVALVAAVDFTCSYPVADGKPIFCRDPAVCKRTDLCVPTLGEPVLPPAIRKS